MAMLPPLPGDGKQDKGYQQDLEAIGVQPKRHSSRSRVVASLVALAVVLLWLSRLEPPLYNLPARSTSTNSINCSHNRTKAVEDFRDIIPSTKLRWQPCFSDEASNMQCARLQVPMDYNRPLSQSADNPTVEIALILSPGTGYANGSYSISPLMLNPGGPGGSGVQLVLGLGATGRRQLLGDYDMLGFDPRGVGWTTPVADCYSFPSPNSRDIDENDVAQGQFNRLEFALSNEAVGLVNSSDVALTKLDGATRAVAQLCEAKDNLKGNDSILRHLDTPNVARDMVSIIDAWDEWRDTTINKEQIEAELHTENSTKGKLVYAGFSYGTLLGATFAAMFPDRVGRVILDGVVDADYYVSPLWSESIEDADTILDSFFSYCAEAGPSKCDIARKGDSASDIRKRVNSDLDALKKQSLVGINPLTHTPSIITWSFMKELLFGGLYSPNLFFPLFAKTLDHLHEGQTDALHKMLPQLHSLIRYQPYCGPGLTKSFDAGDASYAIMCADKRYQLNESISELEQRFEDMANLSSFADVWTTAMLGCDGWAVEPVDPPMRWDDHPSHEQKPIKTSFPLLFVSTSYDPVCPLRGAVKMAKKFEGAGLLERRGEGHCSISATSVCTLKKMRAYIRDGVVPRPPVLKEGQDLRDGEWERCDVDEWPWHPFERDEWMTSSGGGDEDMTSQEAADMIEGWKVMQEHLAHSRNLMGRANPALAPNVFGSSLYVKGS